MQVRLREKAGIRNAGTGISVRSTADFRPRLCFRSRACLAGLFLPSVWVSVAKSRGQVGVKKCWGGFFMVAFEVARASWPAGPASAPALSCLLLLIRGRSRGFFGRDEVRFTVAVTSARRPTRPAGRRAPPHAPPQARAGLEAGLDQGWSFGRCAGPGVVFRALR